MWTVLKCGEFDVWFESLDDTQQEDVRASIRLLVEFGPQLGRPHADSLQGSRHSNMKELRTQSAGRPLRSFFAFDPLRQAVLLIGGDKSGDNRFYKKMIPIADDLFDLHLRELREGP